MRNVSELMTAIRELSEAEQNDLLRQLDVHLSKREDNPAKVEPPTTSIHGRPMTWWPFGLVMQVIRDAAENRWMWYWNTRCKYVELRIDMRDQCCLIRDREGKPISLEQLQYQYERGK